MNNINYKWINNKRGTSNKLVAILVVISLLITIVGTWTVLSQINILNNKMGTNTKYSDNGQVQMTITPTNTLSSSGEVKLDITNKS